MNPYDISDFANKAADPNTQDDSWYETYWKLTRWVKEIDERCCISFGDHGEVFAELPSDEDFVAFKLKYG